MKINWKVRFRNPLFWAEVVAAVVLPALAGMGLRWEDMTSWQALGQVLREALASPVVVVSMLVSLWNAVTDPTTRGICDSRRALGYETPADTGKE